MSTLSSMVVDRQSKSLINQILLVRTNKSGQDIHMGVWATNWLSHVYYKHIIEKYKYIFDINTRDIFYVQYKYTHIHMCVCKRTGREQKNQGPQDFKNLNGNGSSYNSNRPQSSILCGSTVNHNLLLRSPFPHRVCGGLPDGHQKDINDNREPLLIHFSRWAPPSKRLKSKRELVYLRLHWPTKDSVKSHNFLLWTVPVWCRVSP